MTQLLDVAVLGATGTVGERLVALLDGHPWFRLAEVGASDRSAGEPLGGRVGASGEGRLSGEAASLRLRPVEGPWRSPLLLSALPSGVAASLEPALAREGHLVVSNASSHRMGADVPLVVPDVNPDHLQLLETQSSRWDGGLVTNPNCVVAGVVVALAPLHRELGLESVVLTTFQAISGAGRPGPPAADLVDNVLPHIAGEEEKIGEEIQKILGVAQEGAVTPADIRVSATAT
ncbi:MAG TPA: aspartate-semialdehyde dehydrogenase, partial [Longimicrobiales bacterium]|nr:aspartate-semialdehyde dehydrogenase [Longimicrobiales bacterium]